MWAFYLFVIYGALGAVFTSEQATLLYWSNWIQLWSLPLLMVGAVVLGRAADKRNQQAFDDTEAILHEIRAIQEHIKGLSLTEATPTEVPEQGTDA
jgi:membrane protein implicated in regulation of membrane protease activity